MRSTDDLNPERAQPLGQPIRPAQDRAERWVVDDPEKPWIEREINSGRMRNTRPAPPPKA